MQITSASKRLFIALCIGTLSGGASWLYWSAHSGASDFAQLWAAARALLQGANPYEAVGPGRPFEWMFPLLYPLTAVLAAVPFAWLPLQLADALFVGCGAALLAIAMTRDGDFNAPRLLVFFSVAFLMTIVTSQWSTWLTAGVLLPSLGLLLASKPTVGCALFVAYPSRRAAIGAAALTLLSVAVMPSWPRDWISGLSTASHTTPPILRWEVGGPLILLALPYWRRAEARLLVALACVPQTPGLYEALPLFLIVREFREALLLVAATFALPFVEGLTAPYSTFGDWMEARGRLMVCLIYLPALGIVLKQQWANRQAPAPRRAYIELTNLSRTS